MDSEEPLTTLETLDLRLFEALRSGGDSEPPIPDTPLRSSQSPTPDSEPQTNEAMRTRALRLLAEVYDLEQQVLQLQFAGLHLNVRCEGHIPYRRSFSPRTLLGIASRSEPSVIVPDPLPFTTAPDGKELDLQVSPPETPLLPALPPPPSVAPLSFRHRTTSQVAVARAAATARYLRRMLKHLEEERADLTAEVYGQQALNFVLD